MIRIAARAVRIAAALLAVFLIAYPGGLARAAHGDVVVALHGAAGEVTGSLSLVEFQGRTWMVDCGAFQSGGDEENSYRGASVPRKNDTLPPGATGAAGVLITHAHHDHIGRLPLLVEQGYRNPIYLTEPTAAIARVMLRTDILYDKGRMRSWIWSSRSAAEKRSTPIHWFPECEAARAIHEKNRRGRRCSLVALEGVVRRPRPCRTCAELEAARIARLFTVVSWGSPVALGPGVTATFLPAGHIPGAASILLTCAERDGKPFRLLFSGDLGNDGSRLVAGPAPAPAADVVFLEATYGDQERPGDDGGGETFRRDLVEALRAGKTVWIPAFTLDRTQKILREIVLAQERGEIDSAAAVSCTSPTATVITDLYRSALAGRRGWFRQELEGRPDAIIPPGLTAKLPPGFIRDSSSTPLILITAAGMLETASGQSLLETLLPRADVAIFLVGWHEPASPGGRLQAGADTIAVGGRSIPRVAGVRDYGCFSGHGDARDIDRWLATVPKTASLIVTHGDAEALVRRAADLRAKGWKNVRAARNGEVLRFPLSD